MAMAITVSTSPGRMAAGAEVMKPLATPVLGGMVSSLIHVLIVTPVIFFWIRERRLGLQREALPPSEHVRGSPRWLAMAAGVVALVAVISLVVWRTRPGGNEPTAQSAGAVVQTVRAGDLDIVLLSSTGTLRQGRNSFTFEFRRTGTTTLVDVGSVHASANMSMPGMVMSGGVQVTPTGVPGRYAATAEFGMAGTAPQWIYTAVAKGDLDGDGTIFTYVLSNSLTAEVYVEGDGN